MGNRILNSQDNRCRNGGERVEVLQWFKVEIVILN